MVVVVVVRKMDRMHMQRMHVREMMVVTVAQMCIMVMFLGFMDWRDDTNFAIAGTIAPFVNANELRYR